MKILCEVPLQVRHHDQSQYHWLAGPENFLFSFEDKRKLRVFNIKQDAAHEVQSASLAEARHCTSLSWNRDESLLAIVVDKRQVYIWEVRRNSFTQFKPRSLGSSSGGGRGSGPAYQTGSGSAGQQQQQQQRKASKSIEFIAWSKLTNRLAICYASGQILLCELAVGKATTTTTTTATGRKNSRDEPAAGLAHANFSSTWERFIDNSESVLKQIVSIEVSEQADLFVCFSAISEILIMTFDGHTAFYSQGDRTSLFNAKFSPLKREHCPRTGQFAGRTICLAYQSGHDVLLTKRISLDAETLELQTETGNGARPSSSSSSTSSSVVVVHEDGRRGAKGSAGQQEPDDGSHGGGGGGSAGSGGFLVDFHWLGPSRLLLCLASGSIQMIQMDAEPGGSSREAGGDSTSGATSSQQVARLVQTVNSSSRHILCTELLRLNPAPHNSTLGLSSPRGSITSARSNSPANSQTASAQTATPAESPRPTEWEPFTIFEMIKAPRGRDSATGRQSFALAIGTGHQVHYYELCQDNAEFSLEHFDELDLAESLQRVGLRLERARWSRDCSMLALQLTSGHLLIYRTRLQHYLVASHGPRTAYLSAPNEVTILNYGLAEQQAALAAATLENASQASGGGTPQPPMRTDNALILSVPLKPSVLAVGPEHLALGLNNRVRFYSLDSLAPLEPDDKLAPGDRQAANYREREYAAMVAAVGLSSRFAAVQFEGDGRLKLHSLKRQVARAAHAKSAAIKLTSHALKKQPKQKEFEEELEEAEEEGAGRLEEEEEEPDEEPDEERFFPDPSQPESISAFALTEQLLVYCTHACRLIVFCLKTWNTAQVCSYSSLRLEPISKLKPSTRGNQFICLLGPLPGGRGEPAAANLNQNHNRPKQVQGRPRGALGTGSGASALLYDVYSNELHEIGRRTAAPLWPELLRRQVQLTCAMLPASDATISRLAQASGLQLAELGTAEVVGASRVPKMGRLVDALWDTDGRTVLLIEAKLIHAFAVLQHTLEREQPIVEYAASAKKPSSYTTLYAYQGIVSFQTSLGRVVNSILETHDDELKLTRLESRIQAIRERLTRSGGRADNSERDSAASARGATDYQDEEQPAASSVLLNSNNSDSTNFSQKIVDSSHLEAHLEVMLLKVSFLCGLVPICCLPKCRDICKHLVEDAAFNLGRAHSEPGARNERPSADPLGLIDLLLWKVLAAWSLFTLNLDFASLIYRRNHLEAHSLALDQLLNEIRLSGSSVTRSVVREKILALLGWAARENFERQLDF